MGSARKRHRASGICAVPRGIEGRRGTNGAMVRRFGSHRPQTTTMLGTRSWSRPPPRLARHMLQDDQQAPGRVRTRRFSPGGGDIATEHTPSPIVHRVETVAGNGIDSPAPVEMSAARRGGRRGGTQSPESRRRSNAVPRSPRTARTAGRFRGQTHPQQSPGRCGAPLTVPVVGRKQRRRRVAEITHRGTTD